MTRNYTSSGKSALLLVALGIAALYGGDKTLVVLIPAALLVWFSTGPLWRSGRN